MSTPDTFKRPPRAPNKSGYKPVAPEAGRNKGRSLHACRLGPWAQLVAMHRVQQGEPSKHVCAELGISVNTMARWQESWAGDCVHFRAQMQHKELADALALLTSLKRSIAAQMAVIQKVFDRITGDNGRFVSKRSTASKLAASPMPKNWVGTLRDAKPPALKKRRR